MEPQDRLAQLGWTLPPCTPPKGLYRPVVVIGNLAWTSGHLPIREDGSVMAGRLGADLPTEEGARAARQAALSVLASLSAALGGLGRIRRLVKLLGMVQCTPDFQAQPAVLNGASEVFAEVFGSEMGVGARSAVGVAALPLGAAVELEAVFEIQP